MCVPWFKYGLYINYACMYIMYGIKYISCMFLRILASYDVRIRPPSYILPDNYITTASFKNLNVFTFKKRPLMAELKLKMSKNL